MQSLSDYLDERKIAQKDFAAQIGVDKSIVSKICAGKIRPSLDIAFRIKRVTGGAVPFEAFVEPVELPTDPAFWVDFVTHYVGDIEDISRFLKVDTATAIDFSVGRRIPSGLVAMKCFAFYPYAFGPRAELPA
jgi:transcriptional regulator with XRE-family HTH domain